MNKEIKSQRKIKLASSVSFEQSPSVKNASLALSRKKIKKVQKSSNDSESSNETITKPDKSQFSPAKRKLVKSFT